MKMRIFVFYLALASFAQAADREALAILAKAREAFNQNHDRQRHWSWTTTSNRIVTDKNGKLLERIPSVTVESPIRGDGKRCNAVLAWGDGREPYLATADAEARCAVTQELPAVFSVPALLESPQAKIQSRSAEAIVIAIERDRDATASDDPVRRCIGSLQAVVQIDPATFFPKHLDIKAVDSGCEQRVDAVDHYEDRPALKATTLFHKGTIRVMDYALQKAKSGNAAHDYWICIHNHAVNPLGSNVRKLGIWGRYFDLTSSGDRRIVADETTAASELATDSTLNFDTDKD